MDATKCSELWQLPRLPLAGYGPVGMYIIFTYKGVGTTATGIDTGTGRYRYKIYNRGPIPVGNQNLSTSASLLKISNGTFCPSAPVFLSDPASMPSGTLC